MAKIQIFNSAFCDPILVHGGGANKLWGAPVFNQKLDDKRVCQSKKELTTKCGTQKFGLNNDEEGNDLTFGFVRP